MSMPKRIQTMGPSWTALLMSVRVRVGGMLRMRMTRDWWVSGSWVVGFRMGRVGIRPMLVRRRPLRGVLGWRSTFWCEGEAELTIAAQVLAWVWKVGWVGVGVGDVVVVVVVVVEWGSSLVSGIEGSSFGLGREIAVVRGEKSVEWICWLNLLDLRVQVCVCELKVEIHFPFRLPVPRRWVI